MKLFLKIAMFILIADTLLLIYFGKTPSPFVKEQNSADFKHTKICVSPDVPIEADTNLLYCITAPAAWNALKKELKTDTIIAAPFSQTAESLNNFKFNADAVLEEFTTISVKRVVDEITIESKLSCAMKYMEPFLKKHEGMYFGEKDHETHVKAFGFEVDDHVENLVLEQVYAYDYRSDDDFITQILLKNFRYELFLAKVQPAVTLQKTVDSVLMRIKNGEKSVCTKDDVLKIPVVNFNVTHQFDDLLNTRLNGLSVTKANAEMTFCMNESGVELDSIFEIELMCCYVSKKNMIFDRPFLIMLKKSDAEQPYFAAWIANTELMELNAESGLR